MREDLSEVFLSCLDLGGVLQVDELAVSQNLQASQELRDCEVVRMDSLLLLDVLKN